MKKLLQATVLSTLALTASEVAAQTELPESDAMEQRVANLETELAEMRKQLEPVLEAAQDSKDRQERMKELGQCLALPVGLFLISFGFAIRNTMKQRED